jgi:hypothetical protein
VLSKLQKLILHGLPQKARLRNDLASYRNAFESISFDKGVILCMDTEAIPPALQGHVL